MMNKATLIYSDQYREYDFGPDHPLRPIRQQMTYDLICAYGLLAEPGVTEIPPEMATEDEVLAIHDEAYLNTIKTLSVGGTVYGAPRFGFGISDNVPFPGMYEASMRYVGGTLTAGRQIVQGKTRTAFNPSGGLHHAMRDHASGFCILDDSSITIKELLKQYDRILYLDIDAHHGDGVQTAFYNTSRVMTISLHESGHFLFPGTGEVKEMGSGEGYGYAVNVPLRPYTPDEIYLWAFHEVVPPLIQSFDPELILFQMGADAHYLDPITHLNLTTAAYENLFQFVNSLDKPILAVGGGGYHVETVPRVWTLGFASLCGKILADQIPEGYAAKYGITHLRDHHGPKVWTSEAVEIEEFAKQSVRQVKNLIFPIHKI